MRRLPDGSPTAAPSVWRGLAWLVGAVAWLAAAAIGAMLALFFAASMLLIALMTSALLALSAAAIKVRRGLRPSRDPDIIEARHVGGHSWVAYGWDGQR